MKLGIIGAGISGLSTAYYAKRFRLPLSKIAIFEASSRLGGMINSKRVDFENETFFFEKGPRTLRLATGELKEINSIQLAEELNLRSSVNFISKQHPASKNRFIYFNNKINAIQKENLFMKEPKLFGKSDIFGKSLFAHLAHEWRTKPRDASVEDESIWSFISRRLDSTIADNLADPIFKGLCGGDVKYLSTASFLENFYKYELEYGSVTKGVLKRKGNKQPNLTYSDLNDLKSIHVGQSVWRMKYGFEELITKLAENLTQHEDVKIHLNEPIQSLEIDDLSAIKVKTKSIQEDFDIVISCVNSKSNNQILPDKYEKLKSLLNKIETVNMVVINMYFKNDILPAKGFGYLVPTNQNSPILGCIFDSVFNDSSLTSSNLTVMMGGAWFDKYIGTKSNDEIYTMALDELKKHLNIQSNPDVYEVSVIKDSIPQYKVGHQKLLKEIDSCLNELNIDKKLYLNGWSYYGIGVNDCIFNSRKLVQEKLNKNFA